MPLDNLFTGNSARARLVSGIRKSADAVGVTMGTGGKNSLIEAIENPGHFSTNDGATILESIRLADPIEEMGRKVLREAVSRANRMSGDGSSTTCVLTAAIVEEGLKYIADTPVMDIKRSLEECLPLIEKSITDQKREITVNEVGGVATISAEDESIGNMVGEIYKQIGKDGIVHWDISKTFSDHYTIGKGITVNGAGFVSPYMADMDEKSGQFLSYARWTNPHIMLTKQKITGAADFNDLFQTLFNKEIKEVVVFCDEYEASVIPDLIRTRAIRGFKTLLVKMPVLWKDQWYEDLAKVTGATVIDPEFGSTFKTMTPEYLGQVEHITVTKDDVFIDGIKDVSAHLKDLEELKTEDALLRASRLNTKTARYFVGAQSESALAYRRLKTEDAIAAAYMALNGGVVAGGGVALFRASEELPDTIGGKILKIALKAPLMNIIRNCGGDSDAIIEEIHAKSLE